MMLAELKLREQQGDPLRVGLVGAGAMGRGVAVQVAGTPGMEIAFIADRSEQALLAAAQVAGCDGGRIPAYSDPLQAIDEVGDFDVLVEATNSIAPAYRFCEQAMKCGAHVVLMNAEVDLAFGALLQKRAGECGVICTSDAGDQHGVLMTMIEEIELWGFKIVQAGNIKGFLDRYATAEDLVHEAAVRHLDPVQCCAYTDGTKLNIEMALVANGTGLLPTARGMTGPRMKSVQEVVENFNFEELSAEGSVDYILGAEPGGGVYVIGRCDHPLQRQYLEYYKLGEGPYYLFYRPYHLCHLETTRAIAQVALHGKAVLQPLGTPAADVYAFAKRDLGKGEVIHRGVGSAEVFGLIDRVSVGAAQRLVPVWLLEAEPGNEPTLVRNVATDAPLRFEDIALPETDTYRLWQEQNALFAGGCGISAQDEEG